MIVAVVRIELDLPASHSLKDKRHVVKSLTARLANEFRVSAAEVEALDETQRALLGVACISNSAPHANEVLSKAVNFVEAHVELGNLVDYQLEIVHVL
jgi:uncharacterized protein YlxP (DUF503 family)